MKIKKAKLLFKETFSHWREHKVPFRSAALAYYGILSVVPTLLIILAFVGIFFGTRLASNELTTVLTTSIGAKNSQLLQNTIQNINLSGSSITLTFSVLLLLWSATNLTFHLFNSLLDLFQTKFKAAQAMVITLKERLWALLLIFFASLTVLASLVIDAILAFLQSTFIQVFPLALPWFWQLVNFSASFILLALLFYGIFRTSSRGTQPGKALVLGSILSALLFSLLRLLLEAYFTLVSPASVFGAAGSLIALLLWLYYSFQVFLLGAAFTYILGQSQKTSWQKVKTKVKDKIE